MHHHWTSVGSEGVYLVSYAEKQQDSVATSL
jgi:hypothetical protein